MRTMPVGVLVLGVVGAALGGVGDPQTRTDHPWYPGELSCSTFDRLFRTQAELYERVTGRKVASDEDKVLASWYWRNLNYFHCTGGKEDFWGKGLAKGEETREFWSGLFGYGYGLCYADHHQWHGEMDKLLGPGRARSMGVEGHTTFEVWLTGGPYGEGRWALLDHDVSTVVFAADGSRLLGLMELSQDMSLVGKADRSRGFIPAGLHPDDPQAYRKVNWAGYTTGYAGPPPLVNLRAGETLRRCLRPGLEDGKTFAYWGINYNVGGIPGPQRDRTWVNQPERMYKSGRDSGYRPGQARYANAVYTYRPDFASGRYKEGVIDESDGHVTFEWYGAYVIAAVPPAGTQKDQWNTLRPGCTGGLVVRGKIDCPVEVSVDQGRTWHKPAEAGEAIDLTDLVKGHHQYWLRLGAGARKLAGSGLTITTVCQCAPTVIPHVKAGANKVTCEASGRGVVSAGPNMDQAQARLVEGTIGSPAVTLELAAPRQAGAVRVYAAAHIGSGSPPAKSLYNIDCSLDGGKTWRPVLKDWQIVQRPPEPPDWWSQTFNMGDAPLDNVAGPVRVRFTNTGKRAYMRVEAHLVYAVPTASPLKVTFAWNEGGQVKQATHTYAALVPGKADESWTFQAGEKPDTLWVEYAAE